MCKCICTCKCTCKCICICTCKCTCKCMCMCICICICKCICICIHVCVYIYMQVYYPHTHIYIYIYTYVYKCVYIYTFVSFFSLFRFSQPIHRIDIPNIYFGWSPLPQAMSLFGKRFVRWRAQLMVGWWVRETSWERTPIDGDFQLCINVITDEKQMENLLDNYL